MAEKRGILHKVTKALLWTLVTVAGLVILLPALLYVPFIQDFAKNIAITRIEKSTGMDVSLDRLRLRFPLKVEIDGLAMSQQGDTMISAAKAGVDVALLPLLKGTLKVSEASLDDAVYRLNTPDSAIYLKARIDRFVTDGTDLKFNMSEINVGKTVLDGADVLLVLKDTTTASTPDTAQTNMVITAPDIELRNIRFRMRMLPTIDSLYAGIGNARLLDGQMDFAAKTITATSLTVDSVDATYLLPTAEFLSSYKTAQPADTLAPAEAPATPWTIRAGHLGLTGRRATYAVRDARPASGLDFNYLQAADIKISVDSFMNRGMAIRVPIRELSATERCGLRLSASGVFEMDSTAMTAKSFTLRTPNSCLLADALMGTGNPAADPDVPLSLKSKGHFALADIIMAMPTLGSMTKGLNPTSNLTLDADINGTSGLLDVNRLDVAVKDQMSLKAKGRIADAFDFNRMNGRVTLDGDIRNPRYIKTQFLSGAGPAIDIAPLTIKGTVDYKPGLIDGNLGIRSAGGRMALKAKWNQRAQGYDLNLTSDEFPIQKFLPGMGISDISIDAAVKGHGYDPAKRSTAATADIDIHHLTYNGQPLDDISIKARLDTCRLTGNILSTNPNADIDADIAATVTPAGYVWDLSGNVHNIDLQALKLSESPMGGSMNLYSTGRYNPKNGDIDAELNVTDLSWLLGADRLTMPEATARLSAADTLTTASLTSGDLNFSARAFCGLDTLMQRITATGELINRQIADRNADIRMLQRTMPHLHASLHSGRNNPVARYLATSSDIRFNNADLTFNNDSLISLQTSVDGFASGNTRIDSIKFDANQHGRFLVYQASVNNRPGTMDSFAHVSLNGFIAADKLSAFFKQSDINNRQGFFFGLNTTFSDSTLTVRFVPYKPTIAYKKWSINKDNSVVYDFAHRHLDANLKLMSDSSSLHLYTQHAADSAVTSQEDIILALNNINIAEWLSISPFAPPVKGDIDADLRFRWDSKQITGNGIIDVNDLYYGRDRVGTFRLDLDVANDSHTKALRANTSLLIDGVKVITATGNLNDSTALHPFLLDFSMIHFPLRVVNPFLPKDMAQLSGMLNGRMDITGNLAEPVFNGFLDFDSTAVKVGMTGASYAFSEAPIPVDSNVVRFNDFIISGLNKNDLHVNGTVDARRISDIRLDLNLTARDMQVVNSNRPRGASLYGKAFIDLDAAVKGNLGQLNVNTTVDILGGTNVTYVMQDAQSALASQKSDEMVRFVQFSDTSQTISADTIAAPSMAMFVNANLIISEGSTINVDLSPDGKNKVSVESDGNLTYSLTPLNGDGRLTGRLNINKGFVRYSPPFMSEKNFSFKEGCYIAFTGDIMNPTLYIKAVDRLKANVTQQGQNSRIVNFDVLLSVTNTLSNMNVAFDLSTNDDITIENELASMSPEQRANQAMNMLLYNVYTGPGTKANANLSGNPLFSFLESQLNSWTANNIRGVDITFGIDQYDTTTDGAKSTTTSYSYRVSKSLFNDRFKIVVGGNYSTDADADENFSQNLINDISFEYMLNRSGSMYVKLFRHVGYESILEGDITQTGVGFVLKRKINSLRDIFRFARKPQTMPAAATASPQSAINPKEDEN